MLAYLKCLGWSLLGTAAFGGAMFVIGAGWLWMLNTLGMIRAPVALLIFVALVASVVCYAEKKRA